MDRSRGAEGAVEGAADEHANRGTDRSRRPAVRRAVVLGGGFAGMLAASVLARHAEKVVVVDRDRLPAGPTARAGLPQARHGHLLMASGAASLEALLPGLTDSLTAAGARRLALPGDLVTLTPHGWLPRTGEASHGWCLSRDLLDWIVRVRVLADPAIELLQGVHAEGLVGDARRVTGVRVRGGAWPDGRELPADLVVDATGRGSRAPDWLAGLGLPEVAQERVDCGLVYATLLVRAPEEAARFPSVSIRSGPGGGPDRAGVVFPIEDGRWLVTLSATRGAEAPRDEAGFHAFARALPHPLIADLLPLCEPLDQVRRYGNTADRRRRYDRLRRWPAGFAVVGDAVAHTNPAYGHGLSVAAAGVLALARALERRGADDGRVTGEVQRAVHRTTRAAWSLATGQDVLYPDVAGSRPTRGDRTRARLGERLQAVAVRADGTGGDADAVLGTLVRLGTLEGRPADLARPAAVRALLRGPSAEVLPGREPPLTEGELALLRGGGRRLFEWAGGRAV
ncbi:FAD-dependent oxidoreductase [Kitasatospora purpeofusca]|uniref:NAD(P)/FAD-dependent oxidoreductase n=1 Tax=Kitasatospora purpeofusca TaxID=67352 RepID=UPI00386AF75E|nr:FAD-dependent oxidoreductase [Kitasatospora purpeofusca]